MKTRTLIMAILLIAAGVTAQAQRWEWVKGYGTSYDFAYEIKGTVTDNEGNLYVFGEFYHDAEWEGERLLPITPLQKANNCNVLVAKISPQGEMLWKKVVHGTAITTHDIKKIGDTAFACLFSFAGPNRIYDLYWLDTLLTGECDYLEPLVIPSMPMTRFMATQALAYVVFGFNGSVVEQHFIRKSYVDNNGEDIGRQIPGYGDTVWLEGGNFQNSVFDVDSAGNIFLMRTPTDFAENSAGERWSTDSGTVAAVKIWVDGRLAGMVDTRHRPNQWRPHLMKFSHHFDTLLASRYVIQDCINEHRHNIVPRSFLKLDKDANVYITLNMQTDFDSVNYTQTMVFDSLMGMTAEFDPYTAEKGYLIVYDSMLNSKRMIHLQDITPSMIDNTYFTHVAFDYDSNLVFVQGGYSAGQGCGNELPLIIKGAARDTTLYELYNDCFVMKFDRNTWEYTGLMKAPVCRCEMGGSNIFYDNIVAKDNRVFLQVVHHGPATLPSGTFRGPNDYYKSSALVIFDYAGHVIGGDHSRQFELTGIRKNGPLAVVDSVLYLVQITNFAATFGDITVNPDGDNYSYIAKYVNPSLMSPYVYVPPTEPPVQSITSVESNTVVFYPNPAADVLRLATTEGRILSANIVSALGVQYPAAVIGDRIDIAHLPSGIYFLHVTTDNGTHTAKFVKR